MFYVGIDIAKRAHEAVIIDEQGKIVQRSFRFQNTCSGFNLLMQRVRNITDQRPEVLFGMESTSHYWLALYTRLKKDGYQVHVMNPIQPDALRNLYIRQTKTDSRDSFIIAEVLRFGRYSSANVPQDKMFALRELCRNRFYLVDTMSDLKRKITALVDQVFPEYETLFSGLFVQSSVEILSKYPTPERLGRTHLRTLTELLKKASNSRFGQAKAIEIKDAAKTSFGVADCCGVYSQLIICFMEQIRSTQQTIDTLDKKIEEILETLQSPITSITGIGPVLGAVILSEIGDISRFKSADKLAAYAGIDPTVKQSGGFIGVKNHMSKRGTPYLRRAIWLASVTAVQFDPMFHAYYEKKAAEGMRYMKIIGHATKKMTAVIFAVLRDSQPYQPVLQSA